MVAGRQLTIGDFSSINQVLQETEFELPTMSRTEDSTTLQLSNIRCRNVQIGDIQLEYTPTTTGLDIAIDMIGLDVVCQANYNYDGRLLAGQGDVQITSSSNAATVQASLAQATATIPPSSIQLNACNPSVNINNIDFDNGGFLGWVLNLIERLARGIMENLVEDMLCQQLQQALDNAQGLLEQLNEKLDNYSVDLSIDPLQAEHGLDSTTSFLDFSDPQTNVGLWVHQALDQGVAYLQATVQGTTDSSTEMRANIMMREYVLNSDRAFVILEESRTLFYNHDDFLETNIQLQKVQLLGLDTLTALDPFSIIGKYTIQSHVAWEYLALDVDATVDMRPSNLDNSLVTGDAGLLEDVHVVVGLGEIKTTLALLATLHQEQIESLQVGSLLSTANVLPCLVSTVGQMELSSLFIEAGDLYSPYLTGIDSVGLDRILGNILDVLFILYEMVVLQRAPAMFQQDFREMVNQRFLQEYFEIASTVCPPPTLSGSLTNAPESFVDFRDLLLNPVDSFIRGGLGTEPYGDLLSSFVTPNLEAQLMSADQFNERFVKPATRAQSGMAGSLQWPDWVIFNHTSAATTLYDAAIVYVSNLRVYNLDTVIAPLNFLDARGWNELFQTITFANQTRPLNITASILLAIGGEWSPLAMTNQIDVTIEIPSTTLSVGISANMKENEFLQVRLVDLVNPYCWLSTLAPYTDGESITLDALVIETVTVVLDTFRLNSKCISCSSPGAFLLSEILRDDLPAIGFQDVFTSRVLDLIEDVSWNLVRDYDLQGLLEDARSKCSQTNEAGRELFPLQKANEFNRDVGQARREGSAESGILSIDSIETLLGFGLVALQAMCVIVASNQAALMEGGISKESMGSSVFKETSNSSSSFVDWTNLSAVMGTWADFAFEEVRKYLLTPVDKNTEGEKAVPVPEFVSLLRENILDDGGAYVMDLVGTNAMIKWLDVEIVASQVQVLGLEDLSVTEILAPIQPHLLRSQFHFDVLTVTVDATLKHGDTTESVSFVYSAKNISTELDLFVAMDINPIQEVRIGSIFDTSNIFSCIALGLHNIQIHQIKTSIESIDGLQVSGFLQDNFHTSVNSILQQLSERHQNDIISALPVFLDHTFKDVVNALMPDLVTSIQNKCPAPPLYPEAGLVDFRDLLLSNDSSLALGGMGKMPYGNLFQKLYDLFVQNVLRTGPSNRPVINEIFRHITTHQSNASGVLTLQENVFSTHTSMKIAGLEADFAFQVSNITLENIDSVGEPLELIKPMNKSAYVVENTLSFGVDAKPLRMEATILLAVSDGVEMNIRNKLRLAWSIEDVSIMAEVLLKISEKAFAAFPIRDLNNIDCWLATILSQSAEHGPSFRGIGVEDHSFSIGNFTFEISCIECTSPDFDKLLFSLYDFENVTVLERAIREHSNGLLDTEFFPVFLDRIVEDSSTLCPHHSSYDPEAKPVSFLTSPADSLGFMEFASASNKPAYFNIFNGILAAFLLSFGILAKWLLSGRNRKWVQSLSRQGGRLLESQQEKDRMMKNYLDSSTHSLLFSPSIPRNVRYGVPAMIFLNLGLYLGGHFGTLSVVNLDALVAGEEFTIYEFLEFKFFESTNRTYHNGGAEMAILLWVFTGIWPYIKLILSLFLWITPPSRLSVFRRGEALLWIDALAKLSVIDIFTMLLGFAMLLVFIGGPDESLSMSDATLYALKIIVVPRAGFYCLIVAQRMSRVSSRFLLEYHDRVIDAASRDYNEKVHATSTGDSGSCSLSNSAILRHGDNSILPASSFLEEGEDDESAGGAPTGKMNEEPHADNEERSTIPLRDELRDISSTSSPSGQEMMVDEEISVHSMEGYRWGTLGALFGAVTIFIIFVIGCIFAPAISLDTSSISGLAVESGMTYEDVVSEYGVFIVISSILVQARFVLNSRADYVGLGFLLAGALVSITSVFLIQTYHFIKRKLDERRAGAVIPLYGHRGCGLPLYLHLHKWRHMEIYLISVAIGVWQLGSACSYAIHVYCEVLRQIFSVMAYIGLSDDSTAQCSRLQATLPGNLIIIGGSFLMLLLTFFFQAAAQCKKNIADSLRFVDDCDLPMMSIAWSPDKNKNSRYSHLSFSLSTDELSDDLQQRPLPSTPCTTSTTPPGTPKVQEFDNNDCDRNQQRLSATPVYLTPPRSFPLVSESSTRGLDHGRDDDELLALRQTPVNSQGFADENEFYLCYRPSDESL